MPYSLAAEAHLLFHFKKGYRMLDKIIQFSIKNKLAIGIMTLALIIWGVWSASKLPIDALPDVTNNQVQVITKAPTLAAQEVEQFITSPVERAMANLPDLVEMRSFSRFGISVITLVFDDKVNIYFARQIISEKLKEAEEQNSRRYWKTGISSSNYRAWRDLPIHTPSKKRQ